MTSPNLNCNSASKLTKEEHLLLNLLNQIYDHLELSDFMQIFLINKKFYNIFNYEPVLFVYAIKNFYLADNQFHLNLTKFFKRILNRFDPIKEVPELYKDIFQNFLLKIPISKNLVKNCCGEKGFEGWNITRNGGNNWQVENILTQKHRKTCFVSSFSWCEMMYVVKFEDFHPIAKTLFFENKAVIKLGCYVARRWDCTAEGKFRAEIINQTGEKFFDQVVEVKAPDLPNDNTPDHSHYKLLNLTYAHEPDKIPSEIIITIAGKDSRFWRGHFGTRFSDAFIICDFVNEHL
jgi:hypothetical protein